MKALPGWAVDAITLGVPEGLHGKARNTAIQSILVRTARSAIRHQWRYEQWEGLVLNDGRVRRALGEQLRWNGTQVVKEATVLRRMRKAWQHAAELPWDDRWERQEAVERLATQATIAAADGDAVLTDSERAVLEAFGAQALSMAMTRVAFPWRAAMGLSACSEWQTKEALKRLQAKGYLTLVARGEQRRAGKPARASVYVAGPALARYVSSTSHRPKEQLWEADRITTMGGASAGHAGEEVAS